MIVFLSPRQRRADEARIEEARLKRNAANERSNPNYKTGTLPPPPPPDSEAYKYSDQVYSQNYYDQQRGNEYASILDTPLPLPPEESAVGSVPGCPHAYGTDASGRCRYCQSSDSGYSERDPRYFELEPDLVPSSGK